MHGDARSLDVLGMMWFMLTSSLDLATTLSETKMSSKSLKSLLRKGLLAHAEPFLYISIDQVENAHNANNALL